MSITVKTVTVCDLCAMADNREGAHANTPPPGWAKLTIFARFPGEGWTNAQRVADDIICPDCLASVCAFLERRKGLSE